MQNGCSKEEKEKWRNNISKRHRTNKQKTKTFGQKIWTMQDNEALKGDEKQEN